MLFIYNFYLQGDNHFMYIKLDFTNIWIWSKFNYDKLLSSVTVTIMLQIDPEYSHIGLPPLISYVPKLTQYSYHLFVHIRLHISQVHRSVTINYSETLLRCFWKFQENPTS
jgi:hypothetical protein